MLCLVEIAQWFLRERYFIFVISLLSPSRKRCGPLFQETWVPITQGCFVPSILEIGPVILEKMKMWKVYRQRDRRTDDKRSEKLTWAVSSDELKNQQQQNKHAHGPNCWTANLRNISWSATSLSKTMIMHACWSKEKKVKTIHYPLFTWTETSSDFACRPSFVCPSVSLSINFSHFISLGNY